MRFGHTDEAPPPPMPRYEGGWRVAPAPDGRGMPEEPKGPPPHRQRWFWIFVLVLLAINWASLLMAQSGGQPRVKVSFSPYFLDQVAAGQVASFSSTSGAIDGTFKTKVRYPPNDQNATPTTLFGTQVPSFWNTNDLTAQLRAQKVQVNAKNPNPGTSLLSDLLLGFGPTLLLIGLFWFLARRAQAGAGGLGGLGNFGRSQARRVDPEKIRVTFEDVAGIDEAKAELTEIVDFLKTPDRYQKLGGRIPHGVLLFGSPGTGKTLLGGRSPARRTPRFSRSPPRNSSRRSSAWAPRASGICSPRPRPRRRRSSSSTRSTRSAAPAKARPESPAPMTSASRRSIRS